MEAALNKTQREILNLFSNEQSEQEFEEIKSLLSAYFADKVVREPNKSFDTQCHSPEIFEKWKKEHFHKSA